MGHALCLFELRARFWAINPSLFRARRRLAGFGARRTMKPNDFFHGSVAGARDTVPLHPIPKKQTMAVYAEESTHPPLHERELLRRLLVVLYRREPVVTKY